MTELLPCPFCGGEAKRPLDLDGTRRQWWVECNNCGAMSPNSVSELMAELAWNNRPAPSTRMADVRLGAEAALAATYLLTPDEMNERVPGLYGSDGFTEMAKKIAATVTLPDATPGEDRVREAAKKRYADDAGEMSVREEWAFDAGWQAALAKK